MTGPAKTTPRFAMVALAPFALAIAACSQNEEAGDAIGMETQESPARTLATTIAGTDEISIASRALTETGLSTVFDGPSSYTFLAPTDTAFEAVRETTASIEDSARAPLLAAALRDHTIAGALTPEAIREAISANGGSIEMRTLGNSSIGARLDGENIIFSGEDGTTAKMAQGAVVGSNGVLIPIDTLLAPTPAVE